MDDRATKALLVIERWARGERRALEGWREPQETDPLAVKVVRLLAAGREEMLEQVAWLESVAHYGRTGEQLR